MRHEENYNFANIMLTTHDVYVIKIYFEQTHLQIFPYLQFYDIQKFAAQLVVLSPR